MNQFPEELKDESIIHGTLRSCDLIPVFLDLLKSLRPAEYEALMFNPFPAIPAYAAQDDNSEWWEGEESYDLLSRLFDLLDEEAPEGYMFGAHEGNGSDFGFWRTYQDEEESE